MSWWLYTQSAANASGSITSLIQNAINQANDSYIDSDINLRLNLTSTVLVSYDESAKKDITILNHFTGITDGNMDEIHQLRNLNTADICFLIVNTDSITGISWQYGGASYAFAIAKYNYVRDNKTLAHEIGHVQDGKHDRITDPSSGYNHGYRYKPGAWRTIMAYDSVNSQGVPLGYYTRLNFWSNPNKTYNEVARGTTTYEDNSRRLSETRNTVAGFRNYVTSGTLSYNHIWRRNITLTGTVYVPSGITFTIKSGSQISLGGFSIISTGGAIIKEAGAIINGVNSYLKDGSAIKGYCSSVNLACNYAASGNTVEILSIGTTENISFSGKSNLTIKSNGSYYAEIEGSITAYNSPYLNLNKLSVKNVYLNNCQNANLNIWISPGPTLTGLSTYNSSFIFHGSITNSSTAFTPALSTGNITGNYYDRTEIWGSATAVFAGYGSNVSLYEFIELCDVDNYHLHVSNNSHITATNCFYNYDGAPKLRIDGSGSSITLNGSEFQCYLSKENYAEAVNDPQQKIEENISDDPVLNVFNKISKNYFTMVRSINNDIATRGFFDKRKFKNSYNVVIEEFKNFININPTHKTTKAAINTLMQCFKEIENYEEMRLFIEKKNIETEYNYLGGFIKRFLMDYYIYKEDFENAISISDQLLKEYETDKELCIDVLYSKGLILSKNMSKELEASEAFSYIIGNYSDKLFTDLAINELSIMGLKASDKEKKISINLTEFSISNYPNPFNPITIINYSLPSDGKVVIKVYDILGREIDELVNEFKTSGNYSVEFDGSNLASGVYLYRITAGNFISTKKVLLTK